MAITGALAGYDEQQLATEQQLGNQQSIQMNALQMATMQAQQARQQQEQAALQDAASYATYPDATDNSSTNSGTTALTAASTYPLGQGPKTPGGNASVGPDMGVGTGSDGTP